MKSFYVEPFNVVVRVYSKDEFDRFVSESGVDAESCDQNDHGEVFHNSVWISTNENHIIVHEAVHLNDWIIGQHLGMDNISLDSTTELRAYMVEYLARKIGECL